mmetsp:Transcript_242/g.834  ORF Transcript_242/g.834 Transcript_242/m.834 type:complete len:650 (+) Transcript_242:57-2006(+)
MKQSQMLCWLMGLVLVAGAFYTISTVSIGTRTLDWAGSPPPAGEEEGLQSNEAQFLLRESQRLDDELKALDDTFLSLSAALETKTEAVHELMDKYGLTDTDLVSYGLATEAEEEAKEEKVYQGPSLRAPRTPAELTEVAEKGETRWATRFLRHKSVVSPGIRYCNHVKSVEHRVREAAMHIAGDELRVSRAFAVPGLGPYMDGTSATFTLPPFPGGHPNTRHCRALLMAARENHEMGDAELEGCTDVYSAVAAMHTDDNEEWAKFETFSSENLDQMSALLMVRDPLATLNAIHILGKTHALIAVAEQGVPENQFGLYNCPGVTALVVPVSLVDMDHDPSTSPLPFVDAFLMMNSDIRNPSATWDELTTAQRAQAGLLSAGFESTATELPQRTSAGSLMINWNRPGDTGAVRLDGDVNIFGSSTVFSNSINNIFPAVGWFRNEPLDVQRKYPVGVLLGAGPGQCGKAEELLAVLEDYMPVNVYVLGLHKSECAKLATGLLCAEFPDCCDFDPDELSAMFGKNDGDALLEAQQACIAYHHKITIVVEDEAWTYKYISSALWNTLSSGSVPLYYGTRALTAMLPSRASAIMVRDYESYHQVARYLVQLVSNDYHYEAHTAWRTQPFSNAFLDELRRASTSLVCQAAAAAVLD